MENTENSQSLIKKLLMENSEFKIVFQSFLISEFSEEGWVTWVTCGRVGYSHARNVVGLTSQANVVCFELKLK